MRVDGLDKWRWALPSYLDQPPFPKLKTSGIVPEMQGSVRIENVDWERRYESAILTLHKKESRSQ